MRPPDPFPKGILTVHSPSRRTAPFVFNSPHSGQYYPERFLAMSRLDRITVRRSEDSFVDTLFHGVVGLGAPLIAAHFPRAYLDVNREPYELDPKMYREPLPAQANIRSARVAGGLGTIPKVVGEGQDIYAGRMPLAEAMMRIESCYLPYHQRLEALLEETRERFGHAVLIDCHSMPASIRVGDSGLRPDFIIGDRYGASAAPFLSESAIALLVGMGYTVAHNKPYAGGFITEHYGRPTEGCHAIQIEINRGLYLNERTMQPTDGFEALAEDLMQFSARLIEAWDGFAWPMPLAAE